MKNCPDCGSDVELIGKVHCWCDKDFCAGQRCGANELHDKYTCTNPKCGKTGTPDETRRYREHYSG